MTEANVKWSLRQQPVQLDERGRLVAIEGGSDVPFPIRRIYYVYGAPPGVERGFHAHRKLEQLAIAVSGSCTFVLDDGGVREEVRLDRPDRALLMAPMVWHEMRDFSPQCVLLVLASDHYSEKDYIREYSDFLRLTDAGVPE